MLPGPIIEVLGCALYVLMGLPLVYTWLPRRIEIPWAVGLLAFGVFWATLMGLADAALPAHFV